MVEPVRLFVGGLPPDVTSEQLAQRFTPFGTVAACEIVPPKHCDVPGYSVYNQNQGCRGFAYIELLPKDNVSLSRCLSLYNHSKWRGHTLRVESAKPQYLKKLQQEWEQEAAGVPHNPRKKRKKQATGDGTEEEEEEWDGIPKPLDTTQPLNLVISQTRKKTKVLKVSLCTSSKALRHFVEIKPKALNQLAWEYDGEPIYRHIHTLNELWYMREQHINQPNADNDHEENTSNMGATIGPPASLRQQAVSTSSVPAADHGAALPQTSHTAIEPQAVKPAMTQPAKVSAERHAYLKILKSVSTANQKEEAAAAAAAAAARGTTRAKQLQKQQQQSKRQGPQIAPLSQPGAVTQPQSDARQTTSAVVNFLDDFDDDDNDEVMADQGVRDGMSDDDLDRFASDEDDSDEQVIGTAPTIQFDGAEDEVDRQEGVNEQDVEGDGHDKNMLPGSAILKQNQTSNVHPDMDVEAGQQTSFGDGGTQNQEDGQIGDDISDEDDTSKPGNSDDHYMLNAFDESEDSYQPRVIRKEDVARQDFGDDDVDDDGEQPAIPGGVTGPAHKDITSSHGKRRSEPAYQQTQTAAGPEVPAAATHGHTNTSKPQRDAKPKNLDLCAVPTSRPAGKGAALLDQFDSDSEESFHDVGSDQDDAPPTRVLGMQQSTRQRMPVTTQQAASKVTSSKAKFQRPADHHSKQLRSVDSEKDIDGPKDQLDNDILPGRTLKHQNAFKARQQPLQQESIPTPNATKTSVPSAALPVPHNNHGKLQQSKQNQADQLYVPFRSSKQSGKLADFGSDSEENFQDVNSDDEFDTGQDTKHAGDQNSAHRRTSANETAKSDSRPNGPSVINTDDIDDELRDRLVPAKAHVKHVPKVQERSAKANAEVSSTPQQMPVQKHHADRKPAAVATPKNNVSTAQCSLQDESMSVPAVDDQTVSLVQPSRKSVEEPLQEHQPKQPTTAAATPQAFKFSSLGNASHNPAATAAKPAARQGVRQDATLTDTKQQQPRKEQHQDTVVHKPAPNTAPPVRQAPATTQRLALPSVLQFAGSFMRTQTPEEIRSQWLAERDSLAADLKKKTRSTIKKATSKTTTPATRAR